MKVIDHPTNDTIWWLVSTCCTKRPEKEKGAARDSISAATWTRGRCKMPWERSWARALKDDLFERLTATTTTTTRTRTSQLLKIKIDPLNMIASCKKVQDFAEICCTKMGVRRILSGNLGIDANVEEVMRSWGPISAIKLEFTLLVVTSNAPFFSR